MEILVYDNDVVALEKHLMVYMDVINRTTPDYLPLHVIKQRWNRISLLPFTVYSLQNNARNDGNLNILAGTILIEFEATSEALSSNALGMGKGDEEIQQVILEKCREYGLQKFFWHCHSFKVKEDVVVAQMHKATQRNGIHFYASLASINKKVLRSSNGGSECLSKKKIRDKVYNLYSFVAKGDTARL